MSRFTSDLQCRRLRGQARAGRALWELTAPLAYESDLLGATVTVPAGYVTDFASVPRLPLAYLLAGDSAHEAAVIHDWLYTVHAVDGKPVTRRQADAVFGEAIDVSDPNAPGGLMWLAVRLGGGGSWGADGPIQTPAVARAIEVEAP